MRLAATYRHTLLQQGSKSRQPRRQRSNCCCRTLQLCATTTATLFTRQAKTLTALVAIKSAVIARSKQCHCSGDLTQVVCLHECTQACPLPHPAGAVQPALPVRAAPAAAGAPQPQLCQPRHARAAGGAGLPGLQGEFHTCGSCAHYLALMPGLHGGLGTVVLEVMLGRYGGLD